MDGNNAILEADLQDNDGNMQHSSINLNDHLGNDNGQFVWAGADREGHTVYGSSITTM